MRATLNHLWHNVALWFRNASREKPSCGKCGICHHVCNLLDKKKVVVKEQED